MTYRAEIDGLRALAILAVLAYHFFPEILPNGGLGVDIFFVISGFVITASIHRRPHGSLKQFLIDFFTRRIKRIMPALVCMIVITSVVISLIDPFPEQSINTGIAAVIGFANNYLYISEQDYFGLNSKLNPFTHTWSLGVEEQFYFVFPLVFWLGWRLGGWKGVTFLLAGLLLLSLVAWGVVFNSDPLAVFYIVVFRFWQIAAGALAFLLQNRFPPKPSAKGIVELKTIVVASIAILVFFPIAIDRQIATVFCSVATCAALYWIHEDVDRVWALRSRVSIYFGRISYSLYLWHWPIVVFLSWTIGVHTGTAWLGILGSLLIAHLSWAYLEQPLRHAKWSATPKRELGAGLVAIAVAAGGLHLYNVVGRQALLGEQLDMDASLGRSSLFLPYISENGTVWAGRDCTLVDNADIGKEIDFERCTVGETLDNARSRVLIIGNSYAPAFAAAFDVSDIYHGIETSFILSAKFGGSPVPDIEWRSHSPEANVDYWKRVIPGVLQRLEPGDQVLIISDLEKLAPKDESDWVVEAREDLRNGLIALSDQLAKRDIGLSILGPLPFLRDAQCTPQMALRQWRSAELSLCRYYSRVDTIERFRPVTALLQSLVDAGKIHVLDLFEVFCPDEICEYTDRDGVLLYRDVYSHASLEAARRARPLVAEWLEHTHDGPN